MKFRKIVATGLSTITIGITGITLANSQSVSAATINPGYTAKLFIVRKNTVGYTSKGKKTTHNFKKDKIVKALGTKKINGKKYYRVGKNTYIKADALTKFVPQAKQPEKQIPQTPQTTPTQQPEKQPWVSKHLVDTLPSISEQAMKASQLQGDDRLEADKEIAVKVGMSPDSVTAGNQKAFEDQLNKIMASRNDAKNWIEQGGK